MITAKRAQNTRRLLVVAALSALTLGCNSSDKAEEPGMYTLDFENNSYSMAEVEQRFFTTFPHDDPTAGDVVYDRKKWINPDMIDLRDGEGLYLYIRERGDEALFDSVRITSKDMYNLKSDQDAMLFVFKGRLPSANGLWPAWWLNGGQQQQWLMTDQPQSVTDSTLDNYSGVGFFHNTPTAVNPTDWPAAGEIDIIESINGIKTIHNTLHTCPQMFDSLWNGEPEVINCANAVPGDPNSGCSGQSYNVADTEGTFATIWEKQRIRFYYWAPGENVRGQGGPLSENPDPESWQGKALKNNVELLATDAQCDPAMHEPWQCKSCEGSETTGFVNMKMIFNITTCGKWAGLQFDDSDNALANCKAHIFGDGKDEIDNQFIKIEYVSVSRL